MDLDRIEDLIRRYLTAGVAVVVILAGPVAGAGVDPEAGTSAAESGAAGAPEYGDGEIRDGTPGADDGTEPTGSPGAGEEGVNEEGVNEEGVNEDGVNEDGVNEDGVNEEGAGEEGAGEEGAADDPSVDEDGSGDADREPADPADADPTDPGNASDADADEAVDAAVPPTTGAPDPDDPGVREPGTGEATTAAERLGWGPPERADEFRTTGLEGWEPYTGPGHQGQGERTPGALAVEDGILTISGDARGATGGACWGGGQRYGRWEARVRASRADPAYHALLLLWPDADDYPAGGQVDLLELTDPARRSAEFYLHHGEGGDRVRSEVRIDATRWHAWAVEWTREGVTGYVDGEEWFSSTDPGTLPPRAMHLCVQLDFFPAGDAEVRPSRMEVDWVRRYAV